MAKSYRRSIVWLRRDLRLRDNVALGAAAQASDALRALRAELREYGSDLALLQGPCETELAELARRAGAQALFYNRDYEPFALTRDERAGEYLRRRGLDVHAHLDHVVFGAEEVRTDAGEPYRIFTPYARRWRERYRRESRLSVDSLRAARGAFLAACAQWDLEAFDSTARGRSASGPASRAPTRRAPRSDSTS